ncbi:MAG: hypothetical protein B7Y40_08880 [Gammaproteobacteria bacterium 28-57-27]|nr:MAG: hypothetical protein B7Y40_08880 [Gammaproteobacteria bacterium 28-57-27]
MKLRALVLASLLIPITVCADTPEQAAAQKSQEAMKEFGMTLKATLQAAMKEGGAMQAIPVCHTEAPKIAQQMSAKHGVDIHRTSLKPRATPPTEWEMAVLEGFEKDKAAGKPVAELVWKEVVEVDGKPTLRMMKAIGTEDVCLTCHGAAIDPAVMAKIQALYPHDRATGFKAGDMRGAFSVSAPLAAAQ